MVLDVGGRAWAWAGQECRWGVLSRRSSMRTSGKRMREGKG